ncbi:hypothetical protein NKI59_32450 [Mesorhizobium sp. M0598]|uniref:hypothetical protein n=1 Tax=Mesorhizobium sp. M0598 TaxID=2956968 RepID=UPI00333DB231
MGRNPDKFAVDDADWREAVARDAIIRPLADAQQLCQFRRARIENRRGAVGHRVDPGILGRLP